MLKKGMCFLLIVGMLIGCQSSPQEEVNNHEETTTVSYQLHVDQTYIKNEQNEIVQLKGLSTHGLSWYPQYVNKETFENLKKDFQINTIRLAMYTQEDNGYCVGDENNREELKKLIDQGVQYTKELGMYVIIDWHILSDGNPLTHKEEAKAFFNEMSQKYNQKDHVLYEICNEPNHTSWQDIENYAKEVIPIIRKNDQNALIIVGTPTWSQDVDSIKPLDDDNTLYALHFYADTHKDQLREKLKTALKNHIPIFVSEFGMCDASGNGDINSEETRTWLELLDKNHISYIAWNISHKDETSAIFQSDCTKTKDFLESDYSDSGNWLRQYFSGQKQINQEKTTDSTQVLVNTKRTNQWMENQNHMEQWEVSLKNNNEVKDYWTIKVTFDHSFEVSQYWNFDYQIDNQTLIIKPKDYNQHIGENETLKDLGMILKSDQELKVIKTSFE